MGSPGVLGFYEGDVMIMTEDKWLKNAQGKMVRATATRILILATWLLTPLCLGAQPSDIASSLVRPSTGEEQRLRALLAEPIPHGASVAVLRQHFLAKEEASITLDEGDQREAVLRSAVALAPDGRFMNNLARQLIARGQWDEGIDLMRKAVAASTTFNAPFRMVNLAQDLFDKGDGDGAHKVLAEVVQKIAAAQPLIKTDYDRRELLRAAGFRSTVISKIETRQGHFDKGIAEALLGEKWSREAWALPLPKTSASERIYLNEAVAQAMARKLQAYRAAGRLQEAASALDEYLRFSQEVALSGSFMSGLLATAASLRFSQREFYQSEQLLRQSDAVLERLGRSAAHPWRTARARDLIIALSGEKKWAQALQEVDRLNTLAGSDPKLQRQVRNDYDNGVVYFGNRRYEQAVEVLEQAAASQRRRYPETHFFVAQTAGMLGAALWYSGVPKNQRRALPLLKAAVRDYMAPANAEYLENIGYRKERREEIFSAYLEALSSTEGEDATQALGAADWVRGGTVQDALNDAAVRAAASTPELAGVVRREQDAKNEVAGLHSFLASDAGGANTPLPAVAAQMRERIAQLEALRRTLQTDIKAKFPDYDRLVRPTPPSVLEIARQLQPQQALLMLLPTPDSVYVWAVTADRPAGFARTRLSAAQAGALVTRLRRHLDFGMHPDAGRQFDDAAAFALYNALLAPLEAAWRGKTQLIVAAGGVLSQLPFGLLQTHANGAWNQQAPWLIRESAVAQVPSLSAWLAIKSFAKAPQTQHAFLGWGDPAFGSRSIVARPSVARGAASASTLRYGDIPPLPETREELLAIAKALGADRTRDVYLGAKATRASVLNANTDGVLQRTRVLAFATHGLMTGDLPGLTQPALALAASDKEDQNALAPLLTLEDILTLRLNADWVVLSACNTAAGDGRAEEALSGLARGFFYAGSRSLLVTHWSVESESAKRLTTATFAHYASHPQAPKAESLRQAMLTVMALPGYAHPAFWAPYALVGDGGR
jgi:CHAT domain-containing protein